MRAVSLFLCLCVRVYQLTLRPVIGSHCRHEPTCSDYALEALLVHGPFKGIWLSVWRILRCNPWSKSGYDPVPYPKPAPCSHHHSGPHPGKNSSHSFSLPPSSEDQFSEESQASGTSKQVIC